MITLHKRGKDWKPIVSCVSQVILSMRRNYSAGQVNIDRAVTAYRIVSGIKKSAKGVEEMDIG